MVLNAHKHHDINKAVHIAGDILLPALALVPINNNLERLVWGILKEAPYERRYTFYTHMLTKTYLSNATLISRMVQVYEETGFWSRRLSAETVKQNSRQLAKLACGNALIVFDTIVTNAKSYRNMIEAQI